MRQASTKKKLNATLQQSPIVKVRSNYEHKNPMRTIKNQKLQMNHMGTKKIKKYK